MFYRYVSKYKKKQPVQKKPILIKGSSIEKHITDNTVCCCGSGRKYKKCCSPHKGATPLNNKQIHAATQIIIKGILYMDDIEGKIVRYTAGKRDLKRLVKKLRKKSYNSLSEDSKLMLLMCEDTLKALKGKPHNTELSVQY